MKTETSFVVYPPDYQVGEAYENCTDLQSALSYAVRFGEGSCIHVGIKKWRSGGECSLYVPFVFWFEYGLPDDIEEDLTAMLSAWD